MQVINLDTDELITLAEAARTLPGGAVHVSTVHRWRLRGVRGVRLPTLLRGGIRYTSRQAIASWIVATTAAGSGETSSTCITNQREAAIDAAERELEK